MVASAQIISRFASGSGRAFDGSYFTSQTTANYMTESGEPAGTWFGGATARLGVKGRVVHEDLSQVLAGCHPRSGRPLTKPQKQRVGRDGKKHNPCACMDIAFSAPKGLSAYVVVAPAESRKEVFEGFDAAVRAILEVLEADVPLARRGKAGATQQKAKLAFAMFDHITSRGQLDPALHRHCLLMNLCWRGDSWGAVNTKLAMQWVRTLGPLFRVQLAKELRERLGLELFRPVGADGKPSPWFEVKGVPKRLCRHWSSRRGEIEEALGGKDESRSASAQAKARANLRTRAKKEKTPSRDQLFERWRQEAARFGFTPERAERLTDRTSRTPGNDPYPEAWKRAMERLTESLSHFSYRDAVQAVAEELQAEGADVSVLVKRVRQELHQSQEIVVLSEDAGHERYTTRAMWQLEERLLKTVSDLAGREGAVCRKKSIERAIRRAKTMSDEQKQVAREVLRDTRSIRVVTGSAGTGKSFTLGVIRECLEEEGYRVIGGALSGLAKEELAEQAGIKSRTIASYRYHLEKTPRQRVKDRVRHDVKQLLRALAKKKTYRHQPIKFDAKTVLILDEAGMVDTRSMDRLLMHAKKAGATVVLTGDEKQLQPIDAGAPFRHMAKQLRASEMRENRRQHDASDRQAAASIREGKAKAALENFQRRDRLTVSDSRAAAMRELVATWTREGGARDPANHLVLTSTREEARAANRLLQAERQKRRLLPLKPSVRIDSERFFRGDRVLFHKPLRKLGIENGYRATVVKVDPILRRVTVRLDRSTAGRGRSKRSSQAQVTVPLRAVRGGAMTLGYAATTHKLQGQTCQHAYVLLGSSMTDRELSYVQATRGRRSTRLFVDKLHAGEELEEVVKAMSRSRAKDLAHDISSQHSRTQSHSLQQGQS